MGVLIGRMLSAHPIREGLSVTPRIYRNLKEVAPHLASEWDVNANGLNTLEDLWNALGDNPHWICSKGHKWQMRLDARIDQKQNCPYCSGRRIIPGETDLASRFPDIAKDWNFKTNFESPTEIAPFSHSKVWWYCSKRIHKDYEQQISKRTGRGTGCPECSKGRGSSKGEFEVGEFLESLKLKYLQNSRIILKPMELDFYLSDLNIGIEYNGEWMHSNAALKPGSKDRTFKDYHERKLELARDAEVNLVFVWEHDWLEHRGLIEEALLKLIEDRESSPILERLVSFKDSEKFCCSVRV